MQVITTIGPAKPQRVVSSNNNSTVTSAEHLDSECCHLLASNGTATTNIAVHGSPKAATPPHKLCLETSFTSLQSPSSDIHQNSSLNSSTCSQTVYNTVAATNGRALARSANSGHTNITSPFSLHPVLSWEYASLLEEQLLQSFQNYSKVGSSDGVNGGLYSFNIFGANQGGATDAQRTKKVDLIHDDWFGLAPLATPESLSEVSSISSRASSLMLNIDRTLKDMFGHHRGCLPSYGGHNSGGTAASPLLMHGGHGNSVGVSYLNSKSPRILRTGLMNINSRVSKPGAEAATLTNYSSGDEDLSFESAQQHVSSDDGNSSPDNCNNSNSEVFVSIKGTPFSSADSVTVNVDVHQHGKPDSQVTATCSPRSQPLHCSSTRVPKHTPITNALSLTDTSVTLINSSPKQVTFVTPQTSVSDESMGNTSDSPHCQQDTVLLVAKQAIDDNGRTILVQNSDTTSGLEGMMVLHIGRTSNHVPSEGDYTHKPTRERLRADIRHNMAVGTLEEDQHKDSESLHKNVMYSGDSIRAIEPTFSSADTSPVMDDNNFCSSTGNNNTKDFQLCVANTENVIFQRHNGDIKSSSSVLQHTSATDVETRLMGSTRHHPGHRMSITHLPTMEQLPLLSNIVEVHDKAAYAQKKYACPVTSLGKGESSV